MRTVHLAIPHEDIAHAAGYFAADTDAAMTVLHTATLNDDVLRRLADTPAIAIAARFDGDAIVPSIERAVSDQNVAGRFRIAAVVVRTVRRNLDVLHGHVA